MSENYVKGGSFLVRETTPEEVFTPEDFTSEQLQFAKTARDFIDNEVIPRNDEIEEKKPGVVPELLRKAGELGLLMADVPEEYGGLGLDKASSALVTENMSGQGSFSVAFGAHVGIGTLPLVYYGTEELKKKYLPGLADGSLVGCYCLTEPTAGSDALSIRTKAVLSEDGKHYILNGTKQFITNGGFADVFTVFAKIDGEQFTGFVLDKDTPGLKIGPEEHKMGIHGSSTTTVIFEDAKVPVENVIGEIGKGHKIAFNILNIGRFKLGAGAVGSSKRSLEHALAYALERKQFGRRLAEFGAIREKLAEMYARTYAAESTVYRTVGLIDQLLSLSGGGHDEAALQAIEEYSVECAIVKVFGSEVLDYVVDQTVQTYGGYGYCAEYPAERFYRDSRINRIFEGTNEINRLLVPGMLLRKAMKGEVPLFQAAQALQEELMGIPSLDMDADLGLLDAEKRLVANLKKICLFVAGVAAQKFGKGLAEQQNVLLRIADLAIQAYAAESTVLRVLKDAATRGEDKLALPIAAARIVCEEAVTTAEATAREALAGIEEGDTLMTMLAALRRLVRRTPANLVAARETIATKLVEMERVIW
ncbi:acyl-CoA dehydrogenase family protein [Deferrisoma camini]|uniref:acyl-CoA dehydrogenase family protein n=1 Tax=Deferrisoma camini TaxID=1035120 RepID=UPI00046C8FFC|nr:acyl-CoA dehydrogenase family protein [Deferrisoma camini]